ncbi:MPT63 family protein [Mycolicibacterium anyangense]
MTMKTAIAAAAVGLAMVLAPVATAAPTDPNTDTFGGWNHLVDDGGAVITVWKISDLKPSTDTIPGYPLAGRLWEATAAVRAAKGTVTPIIPDFNARSANGTNYPVLWQAATPAGISGATLPQGAKSTGKLYFDVTGPAPTQVVYNNGVADLLFWK